MEGCRGKDYTQKHLRDVEDYIYDKLGMNTRLNKAINPRREGTLGCLLSPQSFTITISYSLT